MSDYVAYEEVDEIDNPNEKGYDKMPKDVKVWLGVVVGALIGGVINKNIK